MSGTDEHVPLRSGTLDALRERGLTVPDYDRTGLLPRIVHIGVGGFHRAHLAAYCNDLAARGGDWGICGIGLLDTDRAMAEALGRQDLLYTLTTRHDDTARTEVVGSIVDYVLADTDTGPATERIGHPTTAIVSLTVTESGYDDGERNRRTFDVIAAGLARRRDDALGGVTILSCDNMIGNGGAARRCVFDAARRHDDTLADWVGATCSFPDSMVDRIAPATAEKDRRHLLDSYGVVDRWPVVAEPFRQWVVEDDFVAGRPDVAAVGAVLTDDVHPWELYKLRLLNAGHAALAHLATLADITHVDEALAVPELHDFLRRFLLDESASTLTPIPGHAPRDYVDDVLARFANTGIRDQVARLCVDGTAKAETFVMPILGDQLDAGGPIRHTAHALAAWAHYLAEVPIAEQASDASAGRARPLAHAALQDPTAFVDVRTGFPPTLVDDPRLAAAFTDAHRAITRDGPLGALRRLPMASS
jgi:mannitol 2-dehydrogenase